MGNKALTKSLWELLNNNSIGGLWLANTHWPERDGPLRCIWPMQNGCEHGAHTAARTRRIIFIFILPRAEACAVKTPPRGLCAAS